MFARTRSALCRACISFDIAPFRFRIAPQFVHRHDLTEAAREEGATIWWLRWGFFQINYRRLR